MARAGANDAKHAKGGSPDDTFDIDVLNLEGTMVATSYDLRQFRPATATEVAFAIWVLARQRRNPRMPAAQLEPIAWALPSIESADRGEQLGAGRHFLAQCESAEADPRFFNLLAAAQAPVVYPD